MIASKDQRTESKRLLRVTPGNVKNSHLYVNEHYDFFPSDCIGGANAHTTVAPLRYTLMDLTKP